MFKREKKKKHLRADGIPWVAPHTLRKKQSGFKVVGLCRPLAAEERGPRAGKGKAEPEWKAAAGGAGMLALTPTRGWPRGSLSRGHPLTGQGTVTFNWLMSEEHFEDEKYQVGIIAIHFLR